jgi:putative endonuclease
MRFYWTYILASKPYGTLYIGVTNDLLGRIADHREGVGSSFTRRYGVTRLVFYEEFDDINVAIQREKSLKRYLRDWKINLIERDNPFWFDLYPRLLSGRHGLSSCAPGGMGPRDSPRTRSEGMPEDDT